MTRTQKIKMAIWMLNRLINKQPTLYKAWKEIYLSESNFRERV